ncbi:DUF2530 domain-containing protein [Agromyces ramosus]|uniref:DUF2530 domain-containing protein n=1 Tax=Agromyces ramosus TaxID=33879 RepID=A0ABU0R4N7_9MICO|nr:DUF2530 domain-containing protein [Agromyces ramosus]MDQ0893044.1 hypothetical protein [Agromyces ramosus]
MRFWLSEDERRPDPVPARADARKAVVAGTVVWALALVLGLMFRASLIDAGFGWFIPASIAGVVLGVLGFVVVQLSRRRSRQAVGGPRG